MAASAKNGSYIYTGVDGKIAEAIGMISAGAASYTDAYGVRRDAVGVFKIAADGHGDVAIYTAADGSIKACVGGFVAAAKYIAADGNLRDPMPVYILDPAARTYTDAAGKLRDAMGVVDFP